MYGVGEKEMLAIVLTLQEFRNIVYGYPVVIHTDHLNLSYDTKFKTARVMRWRLAIEEFSPTIEWLPGERNVVADLLSRQAITESSDDYEHFIQDECFDLPRDFTEVIQLRETTVPVSLKKIHSAQLNDREVQRLRREAPDSLGTIIDNTGERTGPETAITVRDPTTQKERINVPAEIRTELMKW